jgi:formylglycine-generating enzyme required for sulfatase activity
VALLAAGVAPPNPEMTNAAGLAFRLIPPGRFQMGTARGGTRESTRERPRHEVVITRPLWMGVYPVTQKQFRAVMRRNPSYFRRGGDGQELVPRMKTADFPVESVTWHEAAEFASRIGARLPTEAEWEYACRAGSSQPFHTGRTLTRKHANIDDGMQRPCPVGLYAPNAHGLHDLHGNVWEWCHDWLGEDYYSCSPREDPTGPVFGTGRAYRGGGWSGNGNTNRSAARGACTPDFRSNRLGFRVLCEWSG